MMSFRGDEFGRDPARHQIAIGIFVVPDGHVAPAVEQALIGENAVGSDQILDQLRVGRSCGSRRACCAADGARREASSAHGQQQYAARERGSVLGMINSNTVQVGGTAYGSSSVSQ